MVTKFLTRKTDVDPSTLTLDRDPEYVREAEKLADLKGQLARLELEVNNTQAARARQVSAAENLQARAVAVLDGTSAPDPAPSHAALARLYEDRTLLHEAVRLQQDRLSIVHGRVSQAICEKVKPEYQRIIGRLAHALMELSAVLQEEDAFRAALRDHDVHFSTAIHPMAPMWASAERVGRPDDPLSNISGWLAEAREHGYI